MEQPSNINMDLKVMVIDDSETMIKTAKIFLKGAYPQCEVIGAEDGYTALGLIINEKPDIIFLDIMMDRLNGYQTLQAIKSNPLVANIPIVMLSSKDSPFDKARGKMMGCNDYLTKPFTKEGLIGMLRKHLPHANL